ncbi:SWI/SNF related-matrix-associated actin-dependent regulator of chromatin subfamily C [Vigna unguiculata]|uniref:SWI/SNF related-matrix-associated actin-dependent regulator of chromatin subfamily C n=1 Tax=Vigna unguiculata TaxID=3917 RepID=A0A4D6NUZ6_VIGUN|nr:SWI/SNF related-matrix-associated actin-dependent regulator of chromatin subfamily C [Vigna unguiculata]
MEIRKYLIKRFHTNRNVQFELKDLLEINLGDVDARQEVMVFLDYWGLINFDSLSSMGYVDSVKQEEPTVEYHCKSCSVDCSLKGYHCQKQIPSLLQGFVFINYLLFYGCLSLFVLIDFAVCHLDSNKLLYDVSDGADFYICTNCFSNGKFGSGMSSLDFLLMEPSEVPGISGGKWTDQETLLLHEALELYKENWNEISEHVAAKSKSSITLFQMPIEDAYVDCGDDADANALEFYENKISDAIEVHARSLQIETTKADDGNNVKVNEETPKPDNVDDEKTWPSSSAEVGNPVMALAFFLGRMVDSGAAVASGHNSSKSMSVNSPSTVLSARHCFLLEDPPGDNKPSRSKRRWSLEKSIVLKEKAMIDNEEVAYDNCNLKLPSDQATRAVHGSDGSTLKDKVLLSSELKKGISPHKSSQPIQELKNGGVSNDLPAENRLPQYIKSNLGETKNVNAVSDLCPQIRASL